MRLDLPSGRFGAFTWGSTAGDSPPVQEQTDQAQRAITHEHDLNRELQIEREPVLAEARQCRGLCAERPDQRAGQRIARE